jgi:hypothetical protein
MLTAVIWDTDNSGKQVEACRLRTEDGRVRPSSLNPSGLFVLNRPLYDERGRKLTKQDGDEFLKLMPAAYSGARLRVGLEMDGMKGGPGSGDKPGHPFRGNQWSGSGGGGKKLEDYPMDDLLKIGRAAKLYAGYSVDGRKVSATSSHYIKGKDGADLEDAGVDHGATKEHVAAAKLLVDTIRDMSDSEVQLFRSVSFPADKDPMEGLEQGQTLTLDRITSFSEGRGWAARYADRGEGKVSYELIVEGPSKSLPTDYMTGLKHKERITEGSFEVVKIQDGETVSSEIDEGYGPAVYRKQIVLRQVGVF